MLDQPVDNNLIDKQHCETGERFGFQKSMRYRNCIVEGSTVELHLPGSWLSESAYLFG